jgi:hypothetical protein
MDVKEWASYIEASRRRAEWLSSESSRLESRVLPLWVLTVFGIAIIVGDFTGATGPHNLTLGTLGFVMAILGGLGAKFTKSSQSEMRVEQQRLEQIVAADDAKQLV